MSLSVLRTPARFLINTLTRGPKKAAAAPAKKGKGKGGSGDASDNSGDGEAGHIFNIYAGVPDSVLEKDEMYPSWLWSLADPPKSYSQLANTFIYGVGIENATENDYRRFQRQHRKLIIKMNNARLKKSKSPSESKVRLP